MEGRVQQMDRAAHRADLPAAFRGKPLRFRGEVSARAKFLVEPTAAYSKREPGTAPTADSGAMLRKRLIEPAELRWLQLHAVLVKKTAKRLAIHRAQRRRPSTLRK